MSPLGLKGFHFYEPFHQEIYEKIIQMNNNGKAVTILFLKTLFETNDAFDSDSYFISLVANATHSLIIKDVANEIYELSLRRQLIQTAESLEHSSYALSEDREVSSIIEDKRLGGLIFSLGNIVDQAKATNKFQTISKVPLLIGMDAEYGIGMRLDDAFSFPFNMTLGAIEDNSLIYKVGKRIGAHAKRLGVHINFAPVTDINTNPNNPIIGSRSFGEDKINVTLKSLAYLKGMQSEGIMGSAKHFPGHGDTSTDSHKTLPSIDFSAKRINNVELYPYKELIKNQLSTVMVAHMEVPALEKEPKMPFNIIEKHYYQIIKKEIKI